MHQKKHPCADPVDLERLARGLQSPDERTRARAVGSLCPCRVGMELFETHLEVVAQFRKAPSPAVRASVLHVFEEAGEMQNEGYPTSPRELTNEMLHRRRASRFLHDDFERVTKVKRGRGHIRAKA